MSSIRLYSQATNPFTEKVACALALKRVPYVRVELSEPDEIKAINPETQMLPVLEVDGRRVSDSVRILAWLEELYPEPSLFAAEPHIHDQQERLAHWSDSSFAFYWNRWRGAKEDFERATASRSPGLLARIHQHVEDRLGGESEAGDDVGPAEREIMAEVAHRMDDLVTFLGHRDFFYADRPSVADIAVYGMLLVMREGPMPGSAAMLAERPTLVAHLSRMERLAREHIGAPAAAS